MMNNMNRRRFLKGAALGAGTSVLLPAGEVVAAGMDPAKSPAPSVPLAVKVDFPRHGLSFEAPGIKLSCARPRITLGVGPAEDIVEISPTKNAAVRHQTRDTFCGSARETTWKWRDPRGYEVRWTLSRLVVACRAPLTLERSEGCRVQNLRETAVGIWSLDLADRQRGKGQTIQLRVAS